MGYEVTFFYYEKQPGQDDFNRDEGSRKSRTVHIGTCGDPVPMEKVAATIIKEYTRQNIWVDDVEVQEWVKKPLRVAQTKNGVKIGSKTFNLGLNEIMKWAVDDNPNPSPMETNVSVQQTPVYTQQPHPQPQAPQSQLLLPQQYQQQPPQQQYDQNGRKIWPHEQQRMQQQNTNPQMMNEDYQRAMQQGTYATNTQEAYPGQEQQLRLQNRTSMAGLRYAQRMELCDPPPELRADLPGLNVTPGKKYQVMEERIGQRQGEIHYRIIDDSGKERWIGWHYFRQPQMVRQEESYYDPRTGTLQTAATYVDQGSTPAGYEHRPRLLYENDDRQPMYRNVANVSANPQMNNLMSRMDAAVQRRTGRRY